jgi:di/tricarboxylate transporter
MRKISESPNAPYSLEEALTTEIAAVLFILAVAIILFAMERIRADVVALMVLLTLTLTGLLTTGEAFSGFANPAVITVWAIYIVSAALTGAGIADFIAQRILQMAGTSESRLIGVIMLTVGSMSAFMNNIGATAVLLPGVVSIGRRLKIPASKLLIPLAFGSLLGGVTTLIGTPPNLLASAALVEAGYAPFALFDYAPMGLIILVSSVVYMMTIGRHLLPNRAMPESSDLTEDYQLRNYLTELHVLPGSPLLGRTIPETRLGEQYDVTVLGVLRDGRVRLGVLPNAHVQVGDVLLVKGLLPQILQVSQEIGVTVEPHAPLSQVDLTSTETSIVEVVVSQLANVSGKTLSEIDFRGRYGLTVLAIWHRETPITGRLADFRLHLGDVLLVQGRHDRIDYLRREGDFLVLEPVRLEQRRLNKAPIVLAIFGLMILAVAFGYLHISTAAVTAAVLMVLTRAMTMDEAYHAIQWRSVFLIAGMLPMGIAMEKTGTAQFLSDQIINLVGGWGPVAIMIGLFILTSLVTEFMSNAAAAVLIAPIAISTAVTLGVDPRAFVMGIAIAASNSFMTPIGHQASVLVYSPGGYRFFDYARVGFPLSVLIWILAAIFLPIIWPL